METKMGKALNEQIKHEMFSAYLYLSMSAWAESNGYKGAANWLRIQFQEEQAHALHFYDYIKDRGGIVTLLAIDAPQTKWKDLTALFTEVKKHEEKVTSLINGLYSVSLELKDHATSTFLHWFVNEQVEEVKNAQDILDQLKILGNAGSGIYLLDKDLATRVFVAPTFGAQPVA